ncbi:MAG: flagellar motor switch protein FliM [Myxococcota bacterium]
MTDGEDETLTAEELAAINEAFSDREARDSQDVRAEDESVVLRYDLVGASSGRRHDYPALDLVHETFTQHLGMSLQRATRQEAWFTPQRPDILNFSEVYAGLASPCSVIVLQVEGIGCGALLILDPELLLHFIDLLMGGPGGPSEAVELLTTRGFTAAERHLIRHLVDFVDRAMGVAWEEIVPVRAKMRRAEVDPRHAAIFSPSDRVVDFRIDVEWGEAVGEVRLVLPMAALRPFDKRLARTAVTPPGPEDEGWKETIGEALGHVPVRLTGVLGRATLSLRDLLALEEGDLIRLDRDPDGPLELLVEGMPKYAVHPTVHQGNMAVRLQGALGGDADRPTATRAEEAAAETPAEPAAWPAEAPAAEPHEDHEEETP